MIRVRPLRPRWLALAWMLAAGPFVFSSGCDSGQIGGSAPMVKDAPPPPGEMTSDDYIEQQAKAAGKKQTAPPKR